MLARRLLRLARRPVAGAAAAGAAAPAAVAAAATRPAAAPAVAAARSALASMRRPLSTNPTPAFLGGGGGGGSKGAGSGAGGGGAAGGGAAAGLGVRPGAAVVSFDTYRVHQQLQEAGFTKRQAEVVVEIVVAGMEESTFRSTALIATKRDLVDLKQELAEKVFNSSMKFDIGQRHAREVWEKDMLSMKSDVLAKMNVETQRVERQIVEMEKVLTDRHLTRRELTEQRVSVLQNEIAQVEKRILQYGAGTLISLLTVGLGFARLVM